MSFNVKVDARKVTNALEHRVAAAYARETIPALDEIASGIIASIKKRQIWPNEKKGVLKEGLWKGNPRPGPNGFQIDMGWAGRAAAFGPGHEWGFKKKKWFIKPVNLRTNTKQTSKRLGKPILALRFKFGGMIMHSKGHEVSAPRELKPHFKPALESYPVDARMGRAMTDAVRSAGL